MSRAHAAWPASWVPAASFVEHLRAQVPADREPGGALAELPVEDLYLAFACALGVPAACDAFSRTVLAEVDAHVARVDPSPAFKDEARQVIASKLLVAAPGEAPKIAEYVGRGPLSAWVRVVAIRTALNLRRGKGHAAALAAERELDELAAADDVELAVIRRRYRPAFEAALSRSLAGLSVRDRALLRLRFVEGVELARIATMYGVHRATATRWLADTRRAVLDEIRRILTAELGATAAELDSLAGLLRSQLHVSLIRLLCVDAGATP